MSIKKLLNFELMETKDRVSHLNSIDIHNIKLKSSELELAANYILWGKNPDGKDSTTNFGIEPPGRIAQSRRKLPESLDTLRENPAFNEEGICSVHDTAAKKVRKKTLDREEVRQAAPAEIRPIFEDLWRRIDRLDLEISEARFLKGKSEKPPRDSLLGRFSEEEIREIRERAAENTEATLNAKTRMLADLRNEQFVIQDATQNPHIRRNPIPYQPELEEIEIRILPIGYSRETVNFFAPFRNFPSLDAEDPVLFDLLWKEKEALDSTVWVDFREKATVRGVVAGFWDLRKQYEGEQYKEESQYGDEVSAARAIYSAFLYYLREADLSQFNRIILFLRLRKVGNEKVQEILGKVFGKKIGLNYISTILTHKILDEISAAASRHRALLEAAPFGEEWKICSHCGQRLLRDTHYFGVKKSAKDGYSYYCKSCEKRNRTAHSRDPVLEQIGEELRENPAYSETLETLLEERGYGLGEEVGEEVRENE